MMSGNANAWDDYDLQTDHYVDAFDDSGVYYKPLYFGEDGCDGKIEDGTDCTLGSGEGSYVLAEAELYLGSTIANQSDVPQDGSLPAFNLDYLNAFAAASSQSTAAVQGQASAWVTKLGDLYHSIRLLESTYDTSPSTNPRYVPIPFYVDLKTDCYDTNTAERQRTFIIKDLYGSPWNMSFPIRIRERFSNQVNITASSGPLRDGVWYNLLPIISSRDVPITDAEFTDHHRGAPFSYAGPPSYIQYYYATDFTLPGYLQPLLSLLSAPGVSPTLGAAMPLWIKDTYNTFGLTSYTPGEAIVLFPGYVSIDGDKGTGQQGCPP